jgi:sarcosine oxidase subunit beta
MAARTTADVIIIGAGVVGCSIALALSRQRLKTLNVDRLPAAGYGSTSHSSAIVRSFYSHETSCAVAHEARFRWLEWPAFLGLPDDGELARYTECGLLVLVREGEEDLHADNLRVLDAVGVSYELLDRAGITRLHPGMDLAAYGPPKPRHHPDFGQPVEGRIGGGIWLPAAGYVSDPQLAARNLQLAAARLGAQFRFNAGVRTIRRSGTGVTGVALDDGTRIDAPRLVNAAGPHSAQINALAGILESLPIGTRAQRHEVAYLTAPADYPEGGRGVLVDLDAGVYQRPDGRDLLIGTTDPDCDEPDIVDPDAFNGEFSEQWTTQVYRAAQRFPGLGIESRARGTVGLYDVSDDWIPIYDKTELGGYYLAVGTSGNQFKNAPLVGDLLARIILAADRGVDHDSSPAFLELPNVGRRVNLSFYSRNRKLQTTRSVLA